jgi:hypothetical protein
MTNKTTEALDRLSSQLKYMTIHYEGGLVETIGMPPWIDADTNTIRAALDNPNTLPDLPDGYYLLSLSHGGIATKQPYWTCTIASKADFGKRYKRALGDTPRDAALNAIAKIKGE